MHAPLPVLLIEFGVGLVIVVVVYYVLESNALLLPVRSLRLRLPCSVNKRVVFARESEVVFIVDNVVSFRLLL